MATYPAELAPAISTSLIDVSDAEMLPSGELTARCDGVSTYMLGLWIDLVRQADGVRSVPLALADVGPTRQQVRALDCLSTDGVALNVLARLLGIGAGASMALANELVRSGLATGDGCPLTFNSRIFSTLLGAGLASDHRRLQIATLQTLLAASKPAWLAILTVAMQQLLGASSVPAPAVTGAAAPRDAEEWRPRF